MDELTNHNNNFSNFVKNQKLKESLEHTQFNEFIDILRRIEDIKDEIKSLKNLNQNEILNLQTPNNENQITKCDHKNLSPKTFENEKNKNFSSLNTQNIPKYSFDFSEPETLVKISPNELKEKIINSPTQKAQEIEKKNAPEIILEENEIILMAIDECLKQETQQILNEEENLQNKNLIVKKERLLGELTKNLRDKSYNVKGIVLNVTASINKSDKYSTYKITNKIKFDIEIKLKDTMYQNEYNIYLFNAKCELTSRLESLNKNSEIYLLNLKIAIKEGQFYLFQTTETKIFLRILNILDYYNPLFLNEENKKLALENINKPKLLKDSDKFGRKFIPNKNTYSKNLFSNLVDITKNNEFEFLDLIDTGCINEYLTKIPNELKDIANLLVKEVDHTVYCTSNSQSINKGMKKKDACGMILTHKKEEKLTSIELISLKDSNVIKIIHYNKNFTLELKENMIIIINNISLKINKNFDCILENPLEKNINIVGILSKEESAKLKKFRFDKNKDYDCIISLVSNKIIRNIQKVKKIIFNYFKKSLMLQLKKFTKLLEHLKKDTIKLMDIQI